MRLTINTDIYRMTHFLLPLLPSPAAPADRQICGFAFLCQLFSCFFRWPQLILIEPHIQSRANSAAEAAAAAPAAAALHFRSQVRP